MSLDRALYEARGVKREHAKKASRAITNELDKHNAQIKKKGEERYEKELGEISKYHLDRALKNKTYH